MKSINANLKEKKSGTIRIKVQVKAKTFRDKDNFYIEKNTIPPEDLKFKNTYILKSIASKYIFKAIGIKEEIDQKTVMKM